MRDIKYLEIKVNEPQCAGGIVLNKKNQLILVSHQGLSWSFPKGHIEKGEEALTAAKREIYEESGVTDLILIKELGIISRMNKTSKIGKTVREGKKIFMSLFETNQTKLKPIDPKNPEAIWVDFNTAIKLLKYEEDKDFLRSKMNS